MTSLPTRSAAASGAAPHSTPQSTLLATPLSTPIHDAVIDDPAAWTRATVGGKAGLVIPLEEVHHAELADLLARTRSIPATALRRGDFGAPALDALLARVGTILNEGRGLVVLAGLVPERYPVEDLERIALGCGTHWGSAAIQSIRGDKLGHVKRDPSATAGRGYKSDAELLFHTDGYELLGLLCARRARAGGASQVVSALTLHNRMRATRPDLLAALYRGAPLGFAESREVLRGVPVFSCVSGKVSCNFNYSQYRKAAQVLDRPLPADFVAAAECLLELAREECLEFELGEGEWLLMNNFTGLHARSSFTDDPARPRHLMRLWLNVPDGRPVVRALVEKGRAYDRIFEDHAG